jgi:predicted nucleic acid-binding protein
VVSVDISVMLKWAEIHQKSRKQGTPLPVMDSLIGATCKVNNMTLITRNEKDFKHIDIEIINPF